MEFSRPELFPEARILLALAIVGVDEEPVVPALDLLQPIAHGLEEIVIGRDDRAIEIELDHRIGGADRLELPLEVGAQQLGGGDVRGELDDLDHLAASVDHRIIGGLDPHFPPALAEAPEFGRVELAIAIGGPEGGVLAARGIGRVDEHAVVLSHHLVGRVAHGLEEIVIGPQDRAIRAELDDGQRAGQCVQGLLGIAAVLAGLEKAHAASSG